MVHSHTYSNAIYWILDEVISSITNKWTANVGQCQDITFLSAGKQTIQVKSTSWGDSPAGHSTTRRGMNMQSPFNPTCYSPRGWF